MPDTNLSMSSIGPTEIKTFSALQHDLKKLKEWLEKEGCHNVAMESTGIYWKQVYAILEDSFNGNIEGIAGIPKMGLRY